MGQEYVKKIELPFGDKGVQIEISGNCVNIYTLEETEKTQNINDTPTEASTRTKISVNDDAYEGIDKAFKRIDFCELKQWWQAQDILGDRREDKRQDILINRTNKAIEINSSKKLFVPKRQEILIDRINRAIKNNSSEEIFVPRYEPSINNEGNIQFVAGEIPEVGHSAPWWDDKARRFCPERGSRMATEDEYFLIIAYLIKEKAVTWSQAADDSTNIGNFMNVNSPNSCYLEKTGTRKCGEFYGFVGNTCKIVKKLYDKLISDNNTLEYASDNKTLEYAMVGGCYCIGGGSFPLAGIGGMCNPDEDNDCCVGLIVLTKGDK